MGDVSVIWRRIDKPGHESARLSLEGSRWHLTGTAVFASDGQSCRLDYLVVCGSDWRTLSGRVTGWIGSRLIEAGWKPMPAAGGSTESTVRPSQAASTSISTSARRQTCCRSAGWAWRSAPRRGCGPRGCASRASRSSRSISSTAARATRPIATRARGGAFVADLRIDAAGFVTEYPGVWQLERPA